MNQLALTTVFLALLAGIRTAAAAETIPDVKTLADLRKLPAVHAADGLDVRVGLADPGAEAGPWRVIYCLVADGGRAEQRGESRGESRGEYDLGPLTFDLIDPDRGGAAQIKRRAAALFPAGERVYWQAVPVGWVDGRVVRVYAGGSVLMERDLGKSDRRPAYWMTFADEHRPADPTVGRTAEPACPEARWGESVLSRMSTSRPLGPGTLPADEVLPVGVDLSKAWRRYYYPTADGDLLTLARDGDAFTVTTHGRPLTDDLDRHLLARWWVNDEPVAAEQPTAVGMGGGARNDRERPIAVGRVKVGLPAVLGPLKAGDRVGLQLLWVGRHQWLPVAAGVQMKIAEQTKVADGSCPVPVPTNRLDVTVDEHLLAVGRANGGG